MIDRFYGGPIMSYDLRTRFPLAEFKAQFGKWENRLLQHSVTSLSELFALIEKLQVEYRHRLLFRGQTGHYPIRRAVPNPTFVHASLGETSLLPSVWRRVLKQRPAVWHQFRDLTMFEWSTIIYHLFDVQDVQAQELAAGLHRASTIPTTFRTRRHSNRSAISTLTVRRSFVNMARAVAPRS